jgi:acetylxylan esterase
MKQYQHQAFAIAALSLGLLLAAPARGGTYSKVDQATWSAGITGFPSYVNMYNFVPNTVASKPPIVVYTHHCTGSASSSHTSMASLESIADKNGFLIIYPEATGRNCWDAGSTSSLNHSGKGDAPAIVQMVKYALGKYSGDAGRVYLAGDSSGGIMTEAMLGVFPDVFMAGVSIMGVPCGCWADGYDTGGTAQWSNSCAGGTNTKTGAQWGDLVRSYFPGYNGHRPRLQQWHGASDTTLNFKNVAEDIKEWTNVLALSEAPTGTEQNTPKSGTTHQFWKNSCYTVYETFVLANTGHTVSVDGPTLAAYFGIDKAGGQDPETVACPGAVPGGGSGGAGGSPGSGGSTGAGGAAGSTGSKDSGLGGSDGGGSDMGPPGSGGSQETGGASGAKGTGGSAGNGGTQGNGGVSSSGGSTAKGGANGGFGGSAPASGGITGSGGNSGKGGSVASGGNVEKGGSYGSGGAHSTGGANAQGGNSGSGTGRGDTSSGGCTVVVGSHAGHSTPRSAALLLVAVFGLIIRRGRRSRS